MDSGPHREEFGQPRLEVGDLGRPRLLRGSRRGKPALRILIRDRDPKFTTSFDAVLTNKTRRFALTADRDRPDSYLQIVEFPSFETAMANSELPEMVTKPGRFNGVHLRDLRAAGPRRTVRP
jgi:hypothetical protein